MAAKHRMGSLALVGLDIEGEWNVPLLQNAADISGASFLLAQASIDEMVDQYDNVLACETQRTSRGIYKLPTPRGRTMVVVGNERTGIPKSVLKIANHVVSVPMRGKGMSSVNVAVAGAVVLYVLGRDLARQGIRKTGLGSNDVDLLVEAPADPSELGSLLRSVWALGWRRVYLSDRAGVWFGGDRSTILAGRAAARREINRLVIASVEQLDLGRYKRVFLCAGERSGTPLSRLVLPGRGPILVAVGDNFAPPVGGASVTEVYVDHVNAKVPPRFRHRGSIFLSVVSEMLGGGRNG